MHKLLDTTAHDHMSTAMLNLGNEWHGPPPLSHAGSQGPDPLEHTVFAESQREKRNRHRLFIRHSAIAKWEKAIPLGQAANATGRSAFAEHGHVFAFVDGAHALGYTALMLKVRAIAIMR